MKVPAEHLDIAEMMVGAELTDAILPRVLPTRWVQHADYANSRHYHSRDGIRVITEIEFHEDGPWLHVSFSRAKRLPSYEDLIEVKRVFIGRERKAIQVFPAENEHVNEHKFCLHLWSPVGHDPMPDLRTVGGRL